MMNNASDWLIEYKLARKGCRIKMGAEYYIDRLSGLEDKEIIEKFKNTLKRRGKIKTDVRKAISEFEKWLSVLHVKGLPDEIISNELSMFLSYNYSYYRDIPELSHLCLGQLFGLRKFFKNNFSDLPINPKDMKAIAFFLKMNLDNFELLDWLVHLIFYFEKKNKDDKINLTASEKKLLFKFSQIIKEESNYNNGSISNAGNLITREKFKVINTPTKINNYLKRYTKDDTLKIRTSKKRSNIKRRETMWSWVNDGGYAYDKRPENIFIFLSKNLNELLSILKKLSRPQINRNKGCFRLSRETAKLLSRIKGKKASIMDISTSHLTIENPKI